jgi:hypothetical protein
MAKARMTKAAHAALLKTIAHLTKHPKKYSFWVCDIPRRPEARSACLLGWMAYFLGLHRDKGDRLSDVAGVLGFEANSHAFYRWMDRQSMRDRRKVKPAWHDDAATAVRYLRILARRVPV